LELEAAKADLAKTVEQNATATTDSEGVVSGLTTRQAELERKEREVNAKDATLSQVADDQAKTANVLILRENALLPQEEDYRARSISLSDKETQILADATELSTLRDELMKQAKDQAAKEEALNATKESLKLISDALVKKEADAKGAK